MSAREVDARRVDLTVALAADGTPTDVGWGLVRLLPDHSVERTCKGCGARATSPFNPVSGVVEERALDHGPLCPVFDTFRRTT